MKLLGRKKELDLLWEIIDEKEIVYKKIKKWLKENCEWKQ